MIARFAHTLHICFRSHLWLLYLVFLVSGVAIASLIDGGVPAQARQYLMGYFELFGSVAVVLGLAHVLTVEADEDTKEVLLTYPTSRRMLALERMIAGAVLAAGPLLLMLGAFRLYLGGALDASEWAVLTAMLPMKELLVEAGVSWLFLAGLTFLAGTLSNGIGGLLVGGLYWLVDLVSGGRLTAQLYLFGGTFPSPTVVPETNRTLLLVFGIVACVVAAWAFGSNRRRG